MSAAPVSVLWRPMYLFWALAVWADAWADIASRLGTIRQAAQQRWGTMTRAQLPDGPAGPARAQEAWNAATASSRVA